MGCIGILLFPPEDVVFICTSVCESSLFRVTPYLICCYCLNRASLTYGLDQSRVSRDRLGISAGSGFVQNLGRGFLHVKPPEEIAPRPGPQGIQSLYNNHFSGENPMNMMGPRRLRCGARCGLYDRSVDDLRHSLGIQ